MLVDTTAVSATTESDQSCGFQKFTNVPAYLRRAVACFSGCLAYARSAFVMGANDNLQEILALTFALATPRPACILALWQRVIAGSWLSAFLPYGMVAERAYMIR